MMIGLNDDVLFKILRFCDLNTVLSFGRTCKKFHGLMLEREVWAGVVRKLHTRGFVDLYAGQTLNQVSRNDLIGLAKRTLHGPTSWKAGLKPEVAQTHTLELNSSYVGPAPGRVTFESEQALLVPGGQYVIYKSRTGDIMACWELATKRVVWSYNLPSVQKNFRARRMAVDALQTGDGPIIHLLVHLVRPIDGTARMENLIEIIRFNPRTNEKESMITADGILSPRESWISGDCALSYDDARVLTIYNLVTRTLSYHSLPCLGEMYKHDVGTTRDHLVVLSRNTSWHSFTLRLYELEALPRLQPSLPELLRTNEVTVEQWSTVIELFPGDPNPRNEIDIEDDGYHKVSCHASSLRENTWYIWAFMAATDSYGILQKYEVEYTDNGSPPTVKQVSSSGPMKDRDNLAAGIRGITWAGLVKDYENHDLYLFREPEGPSKIQLGLPVKRIPGQMGNNIRLRPFSGEVTYTSETGIVVNHYE